MAIFSKVIKKVFGSKSEKDLKKLYPYIDKINEKFNLLSNISDDELKKKFSEISDNLSLIIKDKKEEFVKQKLDDDKIDEMLYDVEQNYLDEKMVPIYAIIKDAARRICNYEYLVMEQSTIWNMVHYDVQLIGGIALHQGKIS